MAQYVLPSSSKRYQCSGLLCSQVKRDLSSVSLAWDRSDAVSAAANGNVEEFFTALESEAKTDQEQGQEDQNAKQTSSTSSPDKKDDDDEGMVLD